MVQRLASFEKSFEQANPHLYYEASQRRRSSVMKKADLKVVLIGDVGVGKTSLAIRYLDRCFVNSPSTIGAAFVLKQWESHNIAIWDTAGEEKYCGLSTLYCRNAGAAILTFDLTRKRTFEMLKNFYAPMLDTRTEVVLKIIVGTKKDLLQKEKREVTVDDGIALAKNLNFHIGSNGNVPYFETSSLTGDNVDSVFQYIFNFFYPEKENYSNSGYYLNPLNKTSNSIMLHDDRLKPFNGGCC